MTEEKKKPENIPSDSSAEDEKEVTREEETASESGELSPAQSRSEEVEEKPLAKDQGSEEKPEEPEKQKASGAEEEDEGLPRIALSEELKAALEEAEAHLEKKSRKKKTGSGSSSRTRQSKQDPDQTEPEKAAEDFDPNQVEEETQEPPPPPTPRELELKMEILELRKKLREAEQEIERKIKEIKQNKDQAQHIQTQFDSYRARVQKEKADWFNYGHEPLLKELLTVVDNLERALSAADENASAIKKGVELTLRLFKGVLEKFGVKPIDPQGEPFNPEFHQAMMLVEDENAEPGTVVQVHQKGYMLKDRLLRPAMVVVSKSPPQPSSEPGETLSPSEAGDEEEKKTEQPKDPAEKENAPGSE